MPITEMVVFHRYVCAQEGPSTAFSAKWVGVLRSLWTLVKGAQLVKIGEFKQITVA